MGKIREEQTYKLEGLPHPEYLIGKKKCNVCEMLEATNGNKCESCNAFLKHLFKKRRSGNTTRLINRCVDEFFEKGITYIYEGRGERSEYSQTKYAFDLFEKRMKSEHVNQEYTFEYGEFDRIKCFKVIKSCYIQDKQQD